MFLVMLVHYCDDIPVGLFATREAADAFAATVDPMPTPAMIAVHDLVDCSTPVRVAVVEFYGGVPVSNRTVRHFQDQADGEVAAEPNPIQDRIERRKAHAKLMDEIRALALGESTDSPADELRVMADFMRLNLGKIIEFLPLLKAAELTMIAQNTFRRECEANELEAAGIKPTECGCASCTSEREERRQKSAAASA